MALRLVEIHFCTVQQYRTINKINTDIEIMSHILGSFTKTGKCLVSIMSLDMLHKRIMRQINVKNNNMKVAIFLLCLLPLAFAEKRELLGNILNGGQIQNLITSVIKRYGIHANVWQCEKECLELFTNHILDLGCDFTCKGIQSLIQKFHKN
ncbi:uncharacterized protein LOC124151186 [Haliotis rufescens]|uniref:uncharacterized protein LOC124151186 n=1 Tax=Haliotis rufescens TaxID=6454 RepID=UPI00201EA12F|nr:uncharacterized protein LOC124151186 [Haliotis rufescens]